MLEANYLTILLKPNYEKAIDTPQDIIDRGLQVIWTPGSESTLEIWKNSPFYITRALAESAIVPEVIFLDANASLDFVLSLTHSVSQSPKLEPSHWLKGFSCYFLIG